MFLRVAILSVISGGLDSKLVMWDFSKGRPYKIVDFGKQSSYNTILFLFFQLLLGKIRFILSFKNVVSPTC